MKIKLKEARRQAYANAAALIESSDFEQLYGDFWLEQLDDAHSNAEEYLLRAQNEVVAYLRKRS